MADTADPASFRKDEIEKVLRNLVTAETVEHLSRKQARRELEKRLNLSEDSLKSRREEVNSILENLVAEIQGEADTQNAVEGEMNNENATDNKNGTKAAHVSEKYSSDPGSESESNSKKLKVPEPPKNLKKTQARIMTKSDFLKLAMVLDTRIGSHLKFGLKPRTFSSGSCGWYHGGKVMIPVGREKIWCQLGINCTVLGSKEWEETKKRKR